jgi:hypothetical protein
MKANMTNPAVIRRDLACWRELLGNSGIGPANSKALEELISETAA